MDKRYVIRNRAQQEENPVVFNGFEIIGDVQADGWELMKEEKSVYQKQYEQHMQMQQKARMLTGTNPREEAALRAIRGDMEALCTAMQSDIEENEAKFKMQLSDTAMLYESLIKSCSSYLNTMKAKSKVEQERFRMVKAIRSQAQQERIHFADVGSGMQIFKDRTQGMMLGNVLGGVLAEYQNMATGGNIDEFHLEGNHYTLDRLDDKTEQAFHYKLSKKSGILTDEAKENIGMSRICDFLGAGNLCARSQLFMAKNGHGRKFFGAKTEKAYNGANTASFADLSAKVKEKKANNPALETHIEYTADALKQLSRLSVLRMIAGKKDLYNSDDVSLIYSEKELDGHMIYTVTGAFLPVTSGYFSDMNAEKLKKGSKSRPALDGLPLPVLDEEFAASILAMRSEDLLFITKDLQLSKVQNEALISRVAEVKRALAEKMTREKYLPLESRTIIKPKEWNDPKTAWQLQKKCRAGYGKMFPGLLDNKTRIEGAGGSEESETEQKYFAIYNTVKSRVLAEKDPRKAFLLLARFQAGNLSDMMQNFSAKGNYIADDLAFRLFRELFTKEMVKEVVTLRTQSNERVVAAFETKAKEIAAVPADFRNEEAIAAEVENRVRDLRQEAESRGQAFNEEAARQKAKERVEEKVKEQYICYLLEKEDKSLLMDGYILDSVNAQLSGISYKNHSMHDKFFSPQAEMQAFAVNLRKAYPGGVDAYKRMAQKGQSLQLTFENYSFLKKDKTGDVKAVYESEKKTVGYKDWPELETVMNPPEQGDEEIQKKAEKDAQKKARMDALKMALNTNALKHLPANFAIRHVFGETFNNRIKSENKRTAKQKDTSSRLYRKAENARLVSAALKNVQSEAFARLTNSLQVGQVLCSEEDLSDIAAFMDTQEKARAVLGYFLGKDADLTGKDTQAALDQMLQTLLSFDLEKVRLDDDTALAGNAALLESLTWKAAAFDRLSEKYGYFDQLDPGTRDLIREKLARIHAVCDYFILRKDIITDPLYKTHYDDELSFDFTTAKTPEQIRLSHNLVRARSSAVNMLQKNGASDKLIKGMEEPGFVNRDAAKTYKSSQEFFYRRNMEITSIRSQYLTNAPQQEVQNTIRLAAARKQVHEQSKQNALIPFISEQEYQKKQKSEDFGTGLTGKQADKLGMATYKKIMTKQDAERIVKKSNGFLTAVETADGMMEIKPSLPEEVTVNGQKVRVRKVWNLLVKSSLMLVTNEDGSFKTDDEAMQKGGILTRLISIYRSMGEEREVYEKDLRDSYVPVMAEILRKKYEDQGLSENAAMDSAKKEAADICKELLILLDANEDMMPLLPQEIALEKYVERARSFQMADEESMRKYLRGYKFREVQTIKKVIDGVEVSEDVVTEREATEEEIAAAVKGIRRDVEDTKAAVKKVLELDVDSKVVPIPNTCSSNAFFYKNLKQICFGEHGDLLAYRTVEFIRANPQKALDFLKKNLYLIGDAQRTHFLDDVRADLAKLSFSKKPEGLTAAEREEEEEKIRKFLLIAQNFGRYVYHAAGHIFSDEDDGDFTVEGFAAETGQFMVEPFTMHAAIGQYHGSIEKIGDSKHEMHQEGFSAFYNADKPFATDKVELLRIYLATGLKKHGTNFSKVAEANKHEW